MVQQVKLQHLYEINHLTNSFTHWTTSFALVGSGLSSFHFSTIRTVFSSFNINSFSTFPSFITSAAIFLFQGEIFLLLQSFLSLDRLSSSSSRSWCQKLFYLACLNLPWKKVLQDFFLFTAFFHSTLTILLFFLWPLPYFHEILVLH